MVLLFFFEWDPMNVMNCEVLFFLYNFLKEGVCIMVKQILMIAVGICGAVTSANCIINNAKELMPEKKEVEAKPVEEHKTDVE